MEELNRYRCYLCQWVMDEKFEILKSKKERDKYEGVELLRQYCEECYKMVLEEIGFYDE